MRLAVPVDVVALRAAWGQPAAEALYRRLLHAGSWRGLIYEYDFDRAAAESATAFVPPDREQLNLCHARWETGGFW